MGAVPAHTCAASTISDASSVSWSNTRTSHDEMVSSEGSSKRRTTRVRVAATQPDRTHSATASMNASTLSGGKDDGRNGSVAVSDASQHSGIDRRFALAPRIPRPLSRTRTAASVAFASASEATRCDSGEPSTSNGRSSSRSFAAGSGHHHDRTPCTVREIPGTTRPASTNH